MCDSAFLPLINSQDLLRNFGLSCASLKIDDAFYLPAFNAQASGNKMRRTIYRWFCLIFFRASICEEFLVHSFHYSNILRYTKKYILIVYLQTQFTLYSFTIFQLLMSCLPIGLPFYLPYLIVLSFVSNVVVQNAFSNATRNCTFLASLFHPLHRNNGFVLVGTTCRSKPLSVRIASSLNHGHAKLVENIFTFIFFVTPLLRLCG